MVHLLAVGVDHTYHISTVNTFREIQSSHRVWAPQVPKLKIIRVYVITKSNEICIRNALFSMTVQGVISFLRQTKAQIHGTHLL